MQTFIIQTRHRFIALLLLCLSTGLDLSNLAYAANPKDYWVYVANDNVSAVNELLASGFDPNTRSPNQQTGLIQATRDGAWRVFDVLLEAPKIIVDAANQYNETPLMYVALIGDLPRLKRLIARGAKVNKEGWTPLHYAAVKARVEIAKFLLQSGALPNELSPDGDTALILAVRADSLETVQALINGGADPSLSNLSAQDAIDVARSRGKEDLAKALEKIVETRKLKKL